MVLTFVPLALGVPARLRILAPEDFGLMMGVASTSFVAQLLSTRGLQMVVAAKAAAMGFTQVFYRCACVLGLSLRASEVFLQAFTVPAMMSTPSEM